MYNLVHMVAGFGLAVVDFLALLDGPIMVNHKNPVRDRRIQVGGVVPTALMMLSACGVRSYLLSAVGDDYFGRGLIQTLRGHRVLVDGVQRIQGAATPVSVIAVTRHNGERTGFNSSGIFPSVKPSIFTGTLPKQAKYVILDGHNPKCAEKILKQAKRKSLVSVFDFGNPKPGMEMLVKEADVVIIPKAYWSSMWPKLSPDAVVKRLAKGSRQTVVVTMEEKGCMVGSGTMFFHQPSVRVRAVDTNGAGDMFLGAFVYGMLNRWDMRQIAAFACRVGAYSCTVVGKDEKLRLLKASFSRHLLAAGVS